jgi:peroxiredoxin
MKLNIMRIKRVDFSFCLRVVTLITLSILTTAPILAQVKKIPAPELNGKGEWLNTDKPIKLSDNRGKVVLLVFWTDETHSDNILPDIQKLSQKYIRQLLVVFVYTSDVAHNYSPISTDKLQTIIQQHGIGYPIVNDTKLEIWKRYAVDAWPYRFLIDPDGNVIGRLVGEGGYDALDKSIGQTIDQFRALARLDENPYPYTALTKAQPTPLVNLSARPSQQEASGGATPNRILKQVAEPSTISNTASGRFYALVIGNNAYQSVPSLKTAGADARAVDNTLRERFGFETKLLLNATRQDILSAISYYRRVLDQNDSLLIYYAGHGYFDRDADKAYWLPTDARREDNANWISADDITSNIRAVPAKHVLIVSDSCYSGTIYRSLELSLSEPTAREKFVQKMVSGKSRTLMASGGNEPVADGGGGEHSVFAKAFLLGLNEMGQDQFTASELFRDFVQERVAGGANQTPEYNPLRNSGHESGDFVFMRKH